MGAEIGLALAIETAQRNMPDAASWHPASKRARSHGIARSAAGLGKFAHLAWAYHDNEELGARAVEYAEDGIAAHQYVELVGLGSTDELRAPIRRVTASSTVRRALESGQAGMRDTADYYQLAGEAVDAEASAARRVDAATTHVRRGFNGTRIIVDCSAIARTSQQRDASARYEHLLDRQTIQHPIAALCAYDARALSLRAVSELACMHPYASPRATPFLLYAEHGAAFGLAGTLSDGSVPLFLAALRRLGKPAGSELVIDARSAPYIGQQALSALSRHAQELNVTALLRMRRPHASQIELHFPALTIAGALSRGAKAIPSKQKAGTAHTCRGRGSGARLRQLPLRGLAGGAA